MSNDNIKRLLGEFALADKNILGEIVYNKNNGSIALFFTEIIETIGSYYGNPKQIYGRINSGEYITLFNNECILNQERLLQCQRLGFRAQYAILSNVPIKDKKFDTYRCVIENALDWSNLSSLTNEEWDCIKIIDREEALYELDEYTITFGTTVTGDLNRRPLKEENIIEERVFFEIKLNESKEVSYFLDLRNKIISLISFGKQDNINIKEQTLSDRDDILDTLNIPRPYHLITNEPRYIVYDTSFIHYNYHLSDISLADKAEVLEKLYPIFNLASSIYKYQDMPVEMIFLNMIQAVETFHARFYGDNINSFNDRIEKKFKEGKHFEDVRKILLIKDKIKKVPLKKRLLELLIGDYDGLFCDYYFDDFKFVDSIVDTRNYYTHYDPKKEKKALSGEELIKAINVLSCLLNYYICKKLDLDLEEKTRNYLSKL